MAPLPPGFVEGARNLLEGCGGLKPGAHVLILTEDPALGYYDPALAPALAQAARSFGIQAETLEIPFEPFVADLPDGLAARMAGASASVFLARLGDQVRFRPGLGALRPIVSYALDAKMLASGFGRAPHAAMLELKALVDAAVGSARKIRVTCPLGTDFAGRATSFAPATGEVSIHRFPLSVFTPVPAGDFSGRIVQAGFLVGTGSSYYEPYAIPLSGLVTVRFEGTAITGLDGSPGDVAAVRAHYAHVSDKTGAARDHVHSWHAGIHPGCDFAAPAARDFARWSGAAFGNPRILHMHTCGTEAPGEISLNVLDATVRLDDVAVWEAGRLHPGRIGGGEDWLTRWPRLASMFADPARGAGEGPDGGLSGRA